MINRRALLTSLGAASLTAALPHPAFARYATAATGRVVMPIEPLVTRFGPTTMPR